MAAKCPSCSNMVSHVNVEAIDVKGPKGSFKGVSYTCPSCSAILSVELDPLIMKSEIAKEVRGR